MCTIPKQNSNINLWYKVCRIIIACCVIHNLAIRQGVPLQELPRPDGPMPDAVPLPPPNAAGLQTRQRIIQRFEVNLAQKHNIFHFVFCSIGGKKETLVNGLWFICHFICARGNLFKRLIDLNEYIGHVGQLLLQVINGFCCFLLVSQHRLHQHSWRTVHGRDKVQYRNVFFLLNVNIFVKRRWSGDSSSVAWWSINETNGILFSLTAYLFINKKSMKHDWLPLSHTNNNVHLIWRTHTTSVVTSSP